MAAARQAYDRATGRLLHRPRPRRRWSRIPPTARSSPWPPTRPTTRPSSSAASARPTTGPAQQPQRPAARPDHPGPVRAGLDLQADHRHRRPPVRAHHAQLRPSTTPAPSRSATSWPTTTRTWPTARIDLPDRHHRVERQLLQHHRPQPVVRPVPVRPRRPAKRGQAVRARPPSGIALPNEAPGKIPTPGVLHQGPRRPTPTCSQQAQWFPGNSDQVAIGQDEVAGHPAAAGQRLRRLRQRRHLLQPAAGPRRREPDRPGRVQTVPRRRSSTTIDLQPAWRAAMLQGFSGVVNDGERDRPRRLRPHPARRDGHRRQDRHGPGQRPPPGHLGLHLVRAGHQPPVRGRRLHRGRRLRRLVAAPVVREIYDGLFNFPLQPVIYAAAGGGGQN